MWRIAQTRRWSECGCDEYGKIRCNNVQRRGWSIRGAPLTCGATFQRRGPSLHLSPFLHANRHVYMCVWMVVERGHLSILCKYSTKGQLLSGTHKHRDGPSSVKHMPSTNHGTVNCLFCEGGGEGGRSALSFLLHAQPSAPRFHSPFPFLLRLPHLDSTLSLKKRTLQRLLDSVLTFFPTLPLA